MKTVTTARSSMCVSGEDNPTHKGRVVKAFNVPVECPACGEILHLRLESKKEYKKFWSDYFP